MDIADTLAPKSDQLDAVELLAGPRMFTIERVSKGASDEQPVQIYLADFPRPWRPSKGMRRVLVSCWGSDTTVYAGRHVTLWCDPEVLFAGKPVGGIRIQGLSHIDAPKKVPLLVARGKSAMYTVEPLTTDAIVASLRNEWKSADPARKQAIEGEVEALQNPGPSGAPEHPADSAPAVEASRPGAPESGGAS